MEPTSPPCQLIILHSFKNTAFNKAQLHTLAFSELINIDTLIQLPCSQWLGNFELHTYSLLFKMPSMNQWYYSSNMNCNKALIYILT